MGLDCATRPNIITAVCHPPFRAITIHCNFGISSQNPSLLTHDEDSRRDWQKYKTSGYNALEEKLCAEWGALREAVKHWVKASIIVMK